MRREYQATFRSMLGMTLILTTLSVLLFLNGVLGKHNIFIALSILPISILIVLRLRLRVEVEEDSFKYQGIFSSARIRFSEVVAVTRSSGQGYLASRWYGPFVCQFSTLSMTVHINFKFFPVQCAQDILGRLQHLTTVC